MQGSSGLEADCNEVFGTKERLGAVVGRRGWLELLKALNSFVESSTAEAASARTPKFGPCRRFKNPLPLETGR